MEIIYTNHFWNRFQRRKEESPVPLTMELIESSILSPDFTLPDPKNPNRRWHIKKIAGRYLRVVVEHQGNKLIVITLMFDRNLRRKGLCD
nr:hypothetical protein [uncultured bacterium]